MTKTAHFLTSLLFVIVCAGLWFIWRTASVLIPAHLGGSGLTEPMIIMLGYYNWIWALPFPALGYSAVMMDRHDLPVEKVLVYTLVIASICAVLILGTAGLIGWEVAVVHGPAMGSN